MNYHLSNHIVQINGDRTMIVNKESWTWHRDLLKAYHFVTCKQWNEDADKKAFRTLNCGLCTLIAMAWLYILQVITVWHTSSTLAMFNHHHMICNVYSRTWLTWSCGKHSYCLWIQVKFFLFQQYWHSCDWIMMANKHLFLKTSGLTVTLNPIL